LIRISKKYSDSSKINVTFYIIYLNHPKKKCQDLRVIFAIICLEILKCDDFTIVKSFKEKIEQINFEKYDILFMGYHICPEKVKHRNCNKNDINLTIDRFVVDNFCGGIHCYSINKNGARKLLDYINKNGIKRAIDMLFIIPELECFETCPHISFAESNQIYGKNIDSDIQNRYDSIDLHL
jgi:GR25 family glycosyltransferase involved in LPS biosynthesis